MKRRVTAARIAEVTGKTVRAIQIRAKKEGWPYKNGNGRAKLFIITKLPEEIRIELAVPTKAPENNMNQVTLYKDEHTPVGSSNLAHWQNKIALARVDLIRSYLNEKNRAKKAKESVTKAAALFIKGYNTGQLLTQVFEAIGATSPPTVERWVKKWRDSGYDYEVIAPRHGNRKGQRKITDEEWNALLSFALHPNRLRVAECARLTKMSLYKKGIASESSEATMRRGLKDWKKHNFDKWVFCRRGEKALNDTCLPYLERDAGLLDVGEVLVADGHVLNFQILHPFTGKPARMMMVLWYDWASAYPVGWEIMPTENVQSVAASLRRAIITLGKMPKVVYLDNGKAFKARVFTDTSIDFEEAGFYGMFARLGIDTLFAWPYNAQSKPVERFFETFSEFERLMPTYTGTDIAHKPAHLLRNEKLHKQIHEKKYGGWVPTIPEANRMIAGWVKEYAQRPHRGLKGLCPEVVFESGKGLGVDTTALRHLMMAREIKRVHRNGISFMGRHYYDEALYGIRDRVLIKYDFEDLSEILVYDKTGSKLICNAPALEPVHPVARLLGTKEDLSLVKEGIKRKRSLKKQTEQVAREYVETAPVLVSIPDQEIRNSKPETRKKRKIAAIPKAVAEKIEADAAKMTVIDLTQKKEEPLFPGGEPERYEYLMEMECKGTELTLDQMAFMRYFETTEHYLKFNDRYDFLRETFILPEEQEERV